MEARTPIAPVTLSGPLLISASTKGNQLQRPASKNVLQAFPLFRIRILCLYRFGKRSQNLILPSSITMKNYAQYQIIIWLIDLIHYIMIEGFHTCIIPLSSMPSSRRPSAISSIKIRKIFPIPKFTYTGASFAFSVTSFTL